MADLRVTAPAKVNLHLEVLGLRGDDFHELAMVIQSIDLLDTLLFSSADDGQLNLATDIPDLSSGPDNLVLRAAEQLRHHVGTPSLGATIELRKRIPIRAGLAGGSSNAAAALMGLNRLWRLDLPLRDLLELSTALGSDVPFCLKGGRQLCFGRGERLEVAPLPATSQALLLVKDPSLTVSTPWAYGCYRKRCADRYISHEPARERRREALRTAEWLISGTPLASPPPLRNDLQTMVAEAIPAVATALDLLNSAPGQIGVAMSGSGPSCFALFESLEEAIAAKRHQAGALGRAGLQSWCCRLRNHGITVEP